MISKLKCKSIVWYSCYRMEVIGGRDTVNDINLVTSIEHRVLKGHFYFLSRRIGDGSEKTPQQVGEVPIGNPPVPYAPLLLQ